MKTQTLTVAQALIRFLKNQYVERDGKENPFFAGCFGIFGHGNVAGVGQALQENLDFTYYPCRNEQSMAHAAAAYAKVKNRLQTFVCATSIGPGATNMITGAAGATINRLPVLLLPGDYFSRRNAAPLLQELEHPLSQEISVNDCFKPISKYWDRIHRPEQLMPAALEAMRALTSPAETGAVTLCLPHDVQTQAYPFPEKFLEKRLWIIPRPRPDRGLIQKASEWIRASKKPMIVSGGGAIYSGAEKFLKKFAEKTGIPVAETFAGKGSLPYNFSLNLGAMGATGTKGASAISAEADLVIGVGTRYSDFTTASKSAFQNPNVRFININIAALDAAKHAALPLIGDALVALEELLGALGDFSTEEAYRKRAEAFNREWDQIIEKIYTREDPKTLSQAEIIGMVNESLDKEKDIMVCAAGSLPGDLHKLWRAGNSKGFHLDYGFSCMGYEIAGGLGAKMAAPEREVYVMVGDGSYLMLSQEIVTSIQEGYKLIVILIDNHGYASIGGLSRSLGCHGFGTEHRYRDKESHRLDGDLLPIDLAGNAQSLGAQAIKVKDEASLQKALERAKAASITTVICAECLPERKLAGYAYAWWEVPVAEVSEMESVRKARIAYEENRKKQRHYL